MDDNTLLEAIRQIVREENSSIKQDISEIKERLASVEEDLAELKEDHTITRDGVNTLLGWADSAARVIKVPLKSSQE